MTDVEDVQILIDPPSKIDEQAKYDYIGTDFTRIDEYDTPITIYRRYSVDVEELSEESAEVRVDIDEEFYEGMEVRLSVVDNFTPFKTNEYELNFEVEIPDYVEFPSKEVQSSARERIEEWHAENPPTYE
ncbi:hypothetical protein ACOZ4N_15830 [Halorientalis pallida]|uniref:hypothetical protein n=1 Tax=Halorientalis pallida TaxID=2479928 RepID=UPI003C702B74